MFETDLLCTASWAFLTCINFLWWNALACLEELPITHIAAPNYA